MKLPEGTMLSAVAAKGKEAAAFPVFQDLHLQLRHGALWVVACNGTVAVAVRAEDAEDGDFSGLLPIEVVKSAEKNYTEFFHPEIVAGAKDVIARLSKNDTLIAKRTEHVYPDALGLIQMVQERGGIGHVSIDVALLARIAKGLGSDQVTLVLSDLDGERSALVLPANDASGDRAGVIAQVRGAAYGDRHRKLLGGERKAIEQVNEILFPVEEVPTPAQVAAKDNPSIADIEAAVEGEKKRAARKEEAN